MHINCRSLLCNYNEIVDFTLSLNNIFDVMCMTETWLTQLTDDQIDIPGYTFVGKNRRNKRGGGVGIYVKKELKFKTRTDIVSNDETCEIVAIEIVNEGSRNIVVISLYRPPGTDIEAFNDVINVLCSRVKAENKFVYWAGDYNINILNTDSHTATVEFLQTMLSNSFYPAITKPTRITEYFATIIDNIFCSAPTNSFTGILYKNISDHLPIFIINNTKVKKLKESHVIESRDMGEENISKLRDRLQHFDWFYITDISDVNSAYSSFLSVFGNIFNECCPVRRKRTRFCFRKQWMTSALLRSTKVKDKLFKKFQKNPTAENKLHYCRYKNIFTSVKRSAEKEYLHAKLEQAKGNLGETWKIIKSVINKKQNDSSYPDSFNHGDTIIHNTEEISNKFNDFFVTIGPKLDARID